MTKYVLIRYKIWHSSDVGKKKIRYFTKKGFVSLNTLINSRKTILDSHSQPMYIKNECKLALALY
jgi:hypothetical protein